MDNVLLTIYLRHHIDYFMHQANYQTSRTTNAKSPKRLFAEKKLDKIVRAIYLVTDIISEQESLKWSLRKLSLKIRSAIYANFNSEEIMPQLSDLLYQIDLAQMTKVISTMNAEVLKKEVSFIKDILVESSTVSEESTFIGESFFMIEAENPNTAHASISSHPVIISNQVSIPTPSVSQSFIKPPVQKITHNQKQVRPQVALIPDAQKSKRRTTILTLIKQKGELTIKDITNVINDCSEKTIQRELMSLVDDRVLKRVGERRWSKYSLR